MKIMMLRPGPAFSVADVYAGWYRALVELGCTVVDFNLDERLSFYSIAGKLNDAGQFTNLVNDEGAVRLASKGIEAACYEFDPDILLAVSGFYIPVDIYDTVSRHGTKVVLIHTESPYEDDRQIGRAIHADLNIINDPTNLDRFTTAAPTMYLPHCYDPAIHHPGPVASPDHRSDFCFVGTGYPARIAFLEAVDWSEIDVALAGHWQQLRWESPLRKFVAHSIDECVGNEQTADLYRGTQASANLYRREAEREGLVDGWSMGPREVELAAIGTFYLTEPRGENRQILPMVPTFDGPDDFAERLRWYLARPDTRQQIAAEARAAVADRTFTSNGRRLLEALEGL